MKRPYSTRILLGLEAADAELVRQHVEAAVDALRHHRRRRQPVQDVAGTIRAVLSMLEGGLPERERRLSAAFAAQLAGRGGITACHVATGKARSTIRRGLVDLRDPPGAWPGPKRQRRPGGGRKPGGAA